MWNGEIEVVQWFKGAYECPLCHVDCIAEENLVNHLIQSHHQPNMKVITKVLELTHDLERKLTIKEIPYLRIKGRIETKREGTPR